MFIIYDLSNSIQFNHSMNLMNPEFGRFNKKNKNKDIKNIESNDKKKSSSCVV